MPRSSECLITNVSMTLNVNLSPTEICEFDCMSMGSVSMSFWVGSSAKSKRICDYECEYDCE